MRRLMVTFAAVLVLSSVSASWTAVFLVLQAQDARTVQAERAEQRAEDLLAEIRDPVGDTRRQKLFERAIRIEDRVNDIYGLLDGDG